MHKMQFTIISMMQKAITAVIAVVAFMLYVCSVPALSCCIFIVVTLPYFSYQAQNMLNPSSNWGYMIYRNILFGVLAVWIIFSLKVHLNQLPITQASLFLGLHVEKDLYSDSLAFFILILSYTSLEHVIPGRMWREKPPLFSLIFALLLIFKVDPLQFLLGIVIGAMWGLYLWGREIKGNLDTFTYSNQSHDIIDIKEFTEIKSTQSCLP